MYRQGKNQEGILRNGCQTSSGSQQVDERRGAARGEGEVVQDQRSLFLYQVGTAEATQTPTRLWHAGNFWWRWQLV